MVSKQIEERKYSSVVTHPDSTIVRLTSASVAIMDGVRIITATISRKMLATGQEVEAVVLGGWKATSTVGSISSFGR